ncbi:MAG: competence/damage-inducible protein A [Bryobacteraceae bacterium]
MNAEIVAVGSELLTADKIDTNSLWLTAELNAMGVEVVSKCVVGDDRARLTAMVAAAVQRSELVILTGGLGPTEDDVTRDAVAEALGRKLEFRQDLCDWIAARFASFGRSMAENNKRQAYVIEGFEALDNPNGTAPGLWANLERGRALTLLPGPPRELKPMFTAQCVSRLRAMLPPLHIAVKHLRVAGIGESDLDQMIAPVYTRYTNPVTTVLAAPGDIQIYLRARCGSDAEAQGLVEELGAQIEEILGVRIYSRDGRTLEAVVGDLLRERASTLSVAESCTGGLLGGRITAAAGSSDYFAGGFLTYTDAMKRTLLGVPAEVLEHYTAVSEAAAVAMAERARERTGSTYALSVTGFAGPDGGTEADPVGTVYIGLAGPQGAEAKRVRLFGDRQRIRQMAATTALDLLRRRLLGAG